jgi:stage III sporulation protein AD
LDIFQIVAIGIIAVVIILVLKSQKQEIAILVSIITGIVIFLLVAGKLSAILELFNTYINRVNIDSIYFSTLIKIIGIAYVAEFGAEICKDAGENSVASKIELAGKVIIAALSVPILTSLLELMINIIP